MSVTSLGSRQQPQFASTGNTPTFAADLSAVADDSAARGNRYVGTTALRTAFSAWTGLRWFDTDDLIEYLYSGGWVKWESAWIAYTPTLTNVAIGTGGSAANTGRYRYVSGQVVGDQTIILGTSGMSVTGEPTFNLPVTAAGSDVSKPLTEVRGYDVSTGYELSGRISSTTQAVITRPNVSGVNVLVAAISSTTPWTWAANSKIYAKYDYSPA